jgi:CMP-N,N'-diacetyllegionaminic acid synthase
MKILAVIPARGGSKRLPGKNTKLLGKKPLIQWSIETVLGIPEICEVLVSTDSLEIAEIARNAGANVPWLRPDHLATDEASSVEVAMHALDWYESQIQPVDGLLLIQPTSPFRTKTTIEHSLDRFEKNGNTPVISVSRSSEHPMWSLKEEGSFLVPFMENHGLTSRSQDLPTTYFVNGLIYLISPSDIRNRASFFQGKFTPIIVESVKESLDIDTEWDFKLAQYWLEND